jgi:hypothetical protein
MVRRPLYRMFCDLVAGETTILVSVEFVNSVTCIFSVAILGVLLPFVVPGDHAPYRCVPSQKRRACQGE